MSVSISRLVEVLAALGTEFTLQEIITKVKVSPSTARKYVNEMVKKGLVTEKNGKFVVTEKGLFLLEGKVTKAKTVEDKYAYVFTEESGSPLPLRVNSVEKLYVVIKHELVPPSVVEYHLRNGYLAKWLLEQISAKALAQRIREIKSTPELLRVLEEYLGVSTR